VACQARHRCQGAYLGSFSCVVERGARDLASDHDRNVVRILGVSWVYDNRVMLIIARILSQHDSNVMGINLGSAFPGVFVSGTLLAIAWCTKMTITEIVRSRFVLQIFTVDGGNKREFTSYRGGAGAVEVYDFPGKAGLPRFLGYLTPKVATKLNRLAAEWEARQP